MNMGLKCTLWALIFILIKIGGKVEELQLFNMHLSTFSRDHK